MFVLAFLLAGIILCLGFLGDYLFRRTNIPDVLILIFLGFLIGPVFKIIDPAVLAPITQLFASLALLIILFDSGLHLNLFKTLQDSPIAVLLAFLGEFISMILVALFTMFMFNWNLTNGLLLGAIIGGTSSAIVIPLVSRMEINGKISRILSLESVFTDAIVVVVGITLLQLVTATQTENELSMIASGIASQFSVGIVVGIILGIIWLRILRAIKGSLYDDVLTLGILLLFYSIVESLKGSGAIFALTFGLVLTNGRLIYKMLRLKKPAEASKIMKKFHSQISFLIRTFFFVYLGLIISFQNIYLILYGTILTLILLFGRFITVLIASIKNPLLKENRKILTIIFPRGLAAAILAQMIVSSNAPNAILYPDLVITVIIGSVLISSIGSSLIKSNLKRG